MERGKLHRIPHRDPVSGGKLHISELASDETGISIRGRFEIPIYASLDAEQALFLETFLRCRGMFNGVERELGISYPTVRARLDSLLHTLGLSPIEDRQRAEKNADKRQKVLEQLERGEITPQEAKEKAWSFELKEEIKRINKLVAEGKISPEDAADLIDAFYNSEEGREQFTESRNREGERPKEPGAPPEPPKADSDIPDPLRGIVEMIEKLGNDAAQAVNWKEVSETAKVSAKKGLDVLKSGLDDLAKGKFNLGWLGNQATREVQIAIDPKPGTLLRVNNLAGDIKIVATDGDFQVLADAKVRAGTFEEAKQKADAFTLVLEESEGALQIQQPHVSGLSLDLVIHVPATTSVEAKTDTGEVHIVGIEGAVRTELRTGAFTAEKVKGTIDAKLDSGAIHLTDVESTSIAVENKVGAIQATRVTGNMNLRSAAGSIVLQACDGKSIAIEAVTGNVTADLARPIEGTVTIRTVNGNATVSVADGSNCRVSLATLKGNATSFLALQDESKSEQRVSGRLGDGIGSLDVSAVTGNVGLLLRDSETL